MLTIPEEYYRSNTVHRSLGTDPHNGILSCGFLYKSGQAEVNIVFQYYGALLLLDGKGLHIDQEGREYPLYPGCFIQRIPGKKHSTIVHPEGRWLEFYLCFGHDLFDILANLRIIDREHDVLYPGLTVALLKTFTDYMENLRDAKEENLPDMLLKAQQIIFAIYRMHREHTGDNEKHQIIQQACQLLGNCQSERKSPVQIAKELGVGYESFRKMFRQHTGLSPGGYAIMKRMEQAKAMLLNNGASIKQVALELGFPDLFTFSRQFKQMVGVSPSEFRNIH